ncbi:hypothetical protein OM416_27615 [Paenibacillus sp. LS1]|uniref:hypothetical protein n=1 Tax=Paenibacillus sp. LS1 TaxID=2992120 RepID=UPI00222EA423|nr:hypothetical protein [Paenibacillus sp. LS1]MCW3795380.1 hypothetical protein [Paenibacillus sp. LS1]
MRIEILGQEMELNISNQVNGTKTISVLPWPDSRDDFLKGVDVIDIESLKILWSKRYFGISHRTKMFKVLYNTFVDTYQNKSNIDDELTLQTLYCDMILRLGTILEDFAGMCSACREFNLNKTSIAEYFLAYTDPMAFFNSISASGGRRKIKQIFRMAESKGHLNSIFKHLTDDEKELLWKGISVTTDTIFDSMKGISEAIRRETTNSVTYYDMYNKLKHGFAPIYPFLLPVPYELELVPNEMKNEEVLKEYLISGITIMHDKLSGQRSREESEKFNTCHLATPTFTLDLVTKDSTDNMLAIIEEIEKLYRRLVDTYLLYAQGNKRISMLVREGELSEEEGNKILSIIDDELRYYE